MDQNRISPADGTDLQEARARAFPPELHQMLQPRWDDWRRVKKSIEYLHRPSAPVSPDQIEAELQSHPTVNVFLGCHYRRLARNNDLTEDLLPLNWDATEADLKVILNRVENMEAHWSKNPVGRTTKNLRANLFADLAEIEGFHHLAVDKSFDRVVALTFARGKKGPTPDACCWKEGRPHLFEMKSLWAYVDYRKDQLVPLAPGCYAFDASPTRRIERTRDDADAEPEGTGNDSGRRNMALLTRTINSLLGGAAAQLHSYADRMGYRDCEKTILLIGTERAPILLIVRTPKDIAASWLSRRRDEITDVEWYWGGRNSESWGSLCTTLPEPV